MASISDSNGTAQPNAWNCRIENKMVIQTVHSTATPLPDPLHHSPPACVWEVAVHDLASVGVDELLVVG
jgi:hypothetical protein